MDFSGWPALGGHYGLDWLASITAIGCMYFLGNKNPLGFVLYVLSSAAMLGFAILVHSPPIFIANAIATAVTLRGLFRWVRET